MKLSKLIKVIISMPKTIYFNFRILPFKEASKLPFFISYNTQVGEIHRDVVRINNGISRFMIKIGFGGSKGVYSNGKGYISFGKNAKVVFNGRAGFSEGAAIRVDKGRLIFGKNFNANKNCFISCSDSVEFGDNVLLGWNFNIRDSDGHAIFDINDKNREVAATIYDGITIGNHVWFAAHVDVLKGVEIPDNCVVGYNSCVTNKFEEPNCIIAGYPAKVVRENVNWEI